jgi:hypothetical protein
MLKTQSQTISAERTIVSRRLYDRYGAMLLGYLAETLKQKALAEECLVSIFKDFIIENGDTPVENCRWSELRRFAKEWLTVQHTDREASGVLGMPSVTDGIWSNMSQEQRCVFYNAYHCGKPLALIAGQLSKPEPYIRKILAEAFTTIRES